MRFTLEIYTCAMPPVWGGRLCFHSHSDRLVGAVFREPELGAEGSVGLVRVGERAIGGELELDTRRGDLRNQPRDLLLRDARGVLCLRLRGIVPLPR